MKKNILSLLSRHFLSLLLVSVPTSLGAIKHRKVTLKTIAFPMSIAANQRNIKSSLTPKARHLTRSARKKAFLQSRLSSKSLMTAM